MFASDDQVAALLDELTAYYGRAHAVLQDGVHAGGLSTGQRRLFAQHTWQFEDEIRRWVVASAAVAPSALVRGVITLIQWVAPPPCPFRVFARRDEAEDWLHCALRRGGWWRPTMPLLRTT